MSDRIEQLEAELIRLQAEQLSHAIQLVEAKLDLALAEDQERQELAPLLERGRKEREKRWARS